MRQVGANGVHRIRSGIGGAVVLAILTAGVVVLPAAAAAARTPLAPGPDRPGYWLVGSDGGIFSYGAASFEGSTGAMTLNRPVVGLAASPSGHGYWTAASDGGIFAFGDAAFHGSTGAMTLNAPVVGMAATPSGDGYWLVASDGGIFAFGDARFHGSTASRRLDAPIVGIASTPAGDGYWLVARDGGVFGFGSARWYGSMGGRRLNSPVVAMAPTPTGNGYWLVAADGGIFAFGAAGFLGSAGDLALQARVVGMAATFDGRGYWLVAADGGVFSYGAAPYLGSAAEHRPRHPVVGMDARHARPAATAVFYYPWYGTPGADGGWRHWDHLGRLPPDDIAAGFYPSRGAYSSNDGTVIDGQFADMAAAGATTVVTSWWGQRSFEDKVVPQLQAAAARHGLGIAVHLEPYGDRTPALLEYDLNYLLARGIDEVWLYAVDGPPASEWRAVTDRYRDRVRFWAHGGLASNFRNNAFLNYAAAAGFDGVYTYYANAFEPGQLAAICAEARARRLLCSPSASPGYDGRRGVPDQATVERARGRRYDTMWAAALSAAADVVSVTSYNEWHEGTQIEAAAPRCIPGYCYDSYEGAYGRTGGASSRAYLDRTAEWAGRARSGW